MKAIVSEQEIIRLLADGKTQRQAFTIIVKQYSELLYWKIRRIVFDHDDADDVLQNTFLKAWRSIDTFEGKSKLSTWLYRIAINESLDFLRRKSATISTTEDDDGMSIANKLMADEYFDGNKLELLLQEAMAQLPDVQRTVFSMRYYDEVKYSEMSKILNTSEGALKASYHIASQKIREYIQSKIEN